MMMMSCVSSAGGPLLSGDLFISGYDSASSYAMPSRIRAGVFFTCEHSYAKFILLALMVCAKL